MLQREEEVQIEVWREWRSLRPSRGTTEWDTLQLREVWSLVAPVQLEREDVVAGGSGHLPILGGKFVLERLWNKLAGKQACSGHAIRNAHALLRRLEGGAEKERYGRVFIAPNDIVMAHGSILIAPRHFRSFLARGCVEGRGDDSAVALQSDDSAMGAAGGGLILKYVVSKRPRGRICGFKRPSWKNSWFQTRPR